MTVGDRLRKAIERRGFSVREFHRQMEDRGVPGSSYPNIHRYLADKREPTLPFLREAADLLDHRYEWLVVEQGEPTDEEQAFELTRPPRSVPAGDDTRGELVSEISQEEIESYGETASRFIRLHQVVGEAIARTQVLSGAREVMEIFVAELAAKDPDRAPEPTVEAVTSFVEERFTPALAVARSRATYGEVMGAFHSTVATLYLTFFGSAKEETDGTP